MVNIVSKEIQEHGGIENYLYAQQYKTFLRFLMCGGVDDGKSTLIGRLLYDTQHIYEDQLSDVCSGNSPVDCNNKKELDLSLLVDGLQSERMQGITIDVAYRYFFTQKRKFIIIDTPGHEEYTRNMITGASNSNLAILLVDAREEKIRKQTRRHWFISVLMGIKHIVIAINKMDLVNYDQKVFQSIQKEYLSINNQLPVNLDIIFIPISALYGDNVFFLSKNMIWYQGPTLFDILDNIQIHTTTIMNHRGLRFPIQYVVRDHMGCRNYFGTVASGSMHIGQRIKIFPSNINSDIKDILELNKDRVNAVTGESIAITLTDDVDVGRGDILVDARQSICVVQSVLVDIVWMHTISLEINQYFDVKITTKIYRVKIKNIQYQIDIHTFQHQHCNSIPYNGIGLVELEFEEPLILDKYIYYPVTGSMIFIDIITNKTVGAGMVKTPIIHSALKNKKYSAFELALHSLIRSHFPHWNIRDLS